MGLKFPPSQAEKFKVEYLSESREKTKRRGRGAGTREEFIREERGEARRARTESSGVVGTSEEGVVFLTVPGHGGEAEEGQVERVNVMGLKVRGGLKEESQQPHSTRSK